MKTAHSEVQELSRVIVDTFLVAFEYFTFSILWATKSDSFKQTQFQKLIFKILTEISYKVCLIVNQAFKNRLIMWVPFSLQPLINQIMFSNQKHNLFPDRLLYVA